jgi:Rrf2 family transcriptional regulator, nitric oxide-sensitive transcriptional repressor
MRLTQFSDYALRTLLYLGVHSDRRVPVVEVAEAYGISRHHLVKVAGMLTDLQLVAALRGRGGGLRLARSPEAIDVGWVIRRTEPDLHLVECFDAVRDTCPITPACALKHVLFEARQAFFKVLDEVTLADLLASAERKEQLLHLWGTHPRQGSLEKVP